MRSFKALVCIGLVAVAFGWQEARANVFAAELNVTYAGQNAELNFRLNDAADVTVNVYDSVPALVKTINAGALAAGPNTVVWDKTDNGSSPVPDGSYTFEVVATDATGYAGWQKLGEIIYYSPHGVDLQRTTANPNFGRIYVTETGGTSGNGRTTTGSGLFVLSNDLADITGQGDAAYSLGVTWSTSTSSPYDVVVADDGTIYLSDWTDSHSGIWVAQDTDLNSATYLFSSMVRDGGGLHNNGSSDVAGSISELYVEGTGAGKKLYWIDEDANVGGEGPGSVLGIDIGNATDWSSTPTIYYPDASNGNLISNYQNGLVPDGQGGWWIAQYRWTDGAGAPSLLHYDGATVDWNSGTSYTLGISARGSIALSDDNQTLAIQSNSTVVVLDVSPVLSSTGNVVLLDTIDAGEGYGGTSSYDMVFGPAGNLYVVNASSEWLRVFSPPGANAFTTASPAGVEILVAPTSVRDWQLY